MAEQGIEIQIGQILDEFQNVPKEAIEKGARKAARSAVNKLKSTSPKKTGEYASGWATRKQGHGFILYNKKAPGLTHLLEKGHVVKNKKGVFGRAPAHVHIAPVEKEAVTEFEEYIRREIER